VFCIEHNDRSALHIIEDDTDKYFKQIDLRDHNTIITKLGIRTKEIDSLINEMQILVQNDISKPDSECHIDMSKLTIMGHGFGATTAIIAASKDSRIKFVVTFDPFLAPLKEEILNKSIIVK
jgi:cephalosporin-C deacetylase-like acetyl esterase